MKTQRVRPLRFFVWAGDRVYLLRMISPQTRSAFVARENRFTLFRIMR
jgi:hypothetical protein